MRHRVGAIVSSQHYVRFPSHHSPNLPPSYWHTILAPWRSPSMTLFQEGLTIEMWLLRAGVSPAEARRVANGASKALSHKSLAANGDAKGRRSHRRGRGPLQKLREESCLLFAVYLTLTDLLRIQPWSQDTRNLAESNWEPFRRKKNKIK